MLLAWILSHWSDIVKILGESIGTISLIIALLPQSASKNKLISLLETLSLLAHKDSPGTLKLPGTSSVREVIPPASGEGL